MSTEKEFTVRNGKVFVQNRWGGVGITIRHRLVSI